MPDFLFKKVISLAITLVFLFSDLSLGATDKALRPKMMIGGEGKDRIQETLDLKAVRGPNKGLITKEEHERLRKWLEDNNARNNKNRAYYWEARLGVGKDKDIRIYLVQDLFKEFGINGHYAIRDKIIYIDKELMERLWKEDPIYLTKAMKYLQHEIYELNGIIKYGEDKGWTREQLVEWLDETGDLIEVANVLKDIHDKAPKLADETIQEFIPDLKDDDYASTQLAIPAIPCKAKKIDSVETLPNGNKIKLRINRTISILNKDNEIIVRLPDTYYSFYILSNGNIVVQVEENSPNYKLYSINGELITDSLSMKDVEVGWLSFNIFSDGDIASCDKDGKLRVWDKDEGKLISTLSIKSVRIGEYSINTLPYNSNIIITTDSDGKMRAWDKKSGELINTVFDTDSFRIGQKGIYVFQDGSMRVATADSDGKIRVWENILDKGKVKLTATLYNKNGSNIGWNSIKILRNGDILTQDLDNIFRLWHTERYVRGTDMLKVTARIVTSSRACL